MQNPASVQEVHSGSSAPQKAAGSTGRKVVSALFAALLAIFVLVLLALLFFHGLAQSTTFPALGSFTGLRLTGMIGSWYMPALAGALCAVVILLIVLVNIRSLRSVFAPIGISLAVSGFLAMCIGLFLPLLLAGLQGDWQAVLINTTAAFRDFWLICGVFLIVLGALLICIHACIAIIKGGRHE